MLHSDVPHRSVVAASQAQERMPRSFLGQLLFHAKIAFSVTGGCNLRKLAMPQCSRVDFFEFANQFCDTVFPSVLPGMIYDFIPVPGTANGILNGPC